MSTARAQTETEAANVALGHVGQPSIADLASDTNIRARACREHFGAVRDAFLREKWWSFAKGWERPSRDPVDSLGPLKFRFVMPEYTLRIRYLSGAGDAAFDEEAGTVTSGGVLVEGKALVTNVEAPLVAITRRVVDVRLWDPVFLDAFTHELASRLCEKLARSESKADKLSAQAKALLDSAAQIDSKEQSAQTQGQGAPEPSYLSARRGWRAPYGCR